MQVHHSFPRYSDHAPRVPVRRVSLPGKPAIHRFYDTSPVSPSGRYVAYTEFDFEDRLPAPGDRATVVVVDLERGETVHRRQTIAWDTQLGAQVQWGSADDQLYFNDMDTATWRPHGVRADFASGSEQRLDGTVYMVSPDGKYSISPNLSRIWSVQPGYGVVVPDEHRGSLTGIPEDDGVFLTDNETGDVRLLVSLRRVATELGAGLDELDPAKGGLFGFHTKFSPDGRRILFIVRWRSAHQRGGRTRNWIVTMNSDGTGLRVALTPAQWAGGHHPNWCPDSEHIVMNLVAAEDRTIVNRTVDLIGRAVRKFRIPVPVRTARLQFSTFRADGGAVRTVAPSHRGSGHPSWHAGLGAIITDAYPDEPVAFGDGTVPIRLVFPDSDSSDQLLRIATQPKYSGPSAEWRVDPHPAWTKDGRHFVFNAWADGVRAVYIADMREYIADHLASR